MRYAILLLAFALTSLPAQAQRSMSYGKAIAAPARPVNKDAIGIDQHLGEQLPLDLVFRDEQDKEITLGSCVGGKPTVLVLAYYRCPQMCTLVINDLVKALKAIPTDVGDQFNVVVVSFDPKDKPAIAYAKKTNYLQEYGRAGAEKGWHFLTGDQPQITELCSAVGFRYEFDEKKKEQPFNHASGFVVITPYGKLSKYFLGIDYDANELLAALETAGEGKIGKEVEPSRIAILLCYERDPETGKYSLSVMKGLRVIFGTMVLALGVWLVRVWRRPTRSVDAPVGTTDPLAGQAASADELR
jgi:protein SCO1/2